MLKIDSLMDGKLILYLELVTDGNLLSYVILI